jgi:plasmid stability protein
MGDLLIRNVPDDLKRDLTEAARRAGLSLSEEAKRRLRQGAPEESAVPRTGAEFLKSVQDFLSDVPERDREDFADLMDEVVAQRRRDTGRPSPFEE